MIKSKIILILQLLFIQNIFCQTYQRNLFYDGNNRQFVLHIPSNYDPSIAAPLLFNFHGGNGYANQFMATTSDMRNIADTAGFILIYPQALEDPNDGNSTNWLHKSPTNVDDIYFVESIIDSLNNEYLIDNNRIYACGYSLGGEFTYELACRLNSKIAAVAAVARTMGDSQLNTCSPIHPTPVMTILGTADQISLYGGVVFAGITYYVSADDMHSYWTNYNNTNANPNITQIPDINPNDGSSVERKTWSNGDNCVSVEELKINGGGHDWPGTFGNMDIVANNEIWNFVSKYNLNGLIGCSTTSNNQNTNSSNKLNIYPNPFSNNLKLETTFPTHYEIYNRLGKLLKKGNLNAGSNKINLSSLKPDLYILKSEENSMKIIKY
ncbi:MAG: hypothetical protein CL846_01875 [Crocinitomicaceae bacterium]|nr:hypothetical protein [Crocinitomicaceae bacterium]|tara:strand:- start:942 stop:2084 length:1143 start_codon:yes stop_codon:yes gene_type:complete